MTVTVAEPLPTVTKPIAEPPPAAPTIAAFVAAGCHDEKPDSIDCTGSTIRDVADCREPLYVQNVKLDPPAAIVTCTVDMQKSKEGIRVGGCMLRSQVHFLAATTSGIVHVSTVKQFKSLFAPVTSGEEAIAFATLLTGDVPYEKPFSAPPGSKIHVGGSQSTHALADGDTYKLRLFHAQICGCSHPLSGVDYVVDREGDVTESARTELWEDSKSHGLCVD